MNASGRLQARAKLAAFALLVPLTLVLSCADMPTAPTPTVHLNGSILDKDGQPMGFIALDFWAPGVRIPPYYTVPDSIPPGEPSFYRTITRPDGTFDLWLPARNYDVEVIPWDGSGYSRAWIVSVPVVPEEPRWDYRYTWPRVTVRTIQPDGSVIANSRVVFSAWDPLPYSTTIARPDSDGLKAVLPPGPFSLIVRPGGLEAGYLEYYTTLTVARDTTITVTAGGNTVNARVLGQNGDPLSGAGVYTQGGSESAVSISGTDGIAVFHLPSAGYSFSVYPSETYIASRQFPTRSIMGPETFDLDVSGTAWSGTVRRAGDGAPLSGIRVATFARASNSSRAYIESDAAGAFHLIVMKNVGHDIGLYDQSGYKVGAVINLFAGNDSTFDLSANVPVP
jgi:hypothetical protein